MAIDVKLWLETSPSIGQQGPIGSRTSSTDSPVKTVDREIGIYVGHFG